MESGEPVWIGDEGLLSANAAADLALSLPAGSTQVLCGMDADAFRAELDRYAQPGVSRLVLFVEPRLTVQAEFIVEEVLDGLAGAALACWPLWYGGADLASYRSTTLQREAARLALLEITRTRSDVSVAWGQAAAALANTSRPPRVPGCHATTELSQLVLALNPAGLPASSTPVIWAS